MIISLHLNWFVEDLNSATREVNRVENYCFYRIKYDGGIS